jgi:8-oxo-dGTP pyrophosphatase MutT (NUDIX family)
MAAAARGHATIIVYFRDTDGNFQILSGLGHSWVSDVIPWIKNLERVKMEDGSKYDNQERAIRHFKEKVLDIHFKDKGYKFEKPTKKFIDGKGNRWITKFYKRGNKMSLPKGNKEESDINLEATAYRELKEETSISGKFNLYELQEIPELLGRTKIFLLPLVQGSSLFNYIKSILNTRRSYMGELFDLEFRELTRVRRLRSNFVTNTILNHRYIEKFLTDTLRVVEEKGERGVKRGREDRGSSGDKKPRGPPASGTGGPAASGDGGPAASGDGGPAASGEGGSRKYKINYYK